ncbi:hypothetical protein FXO37_08488 [Capsicum annuum]|nr:hypothetical protein FXO37_08488 [Capsicum annuum]
MITAVFRNTLALSHNAMMQSDESPSRCVYHYCYFFFLATTTAISSSSLLHFNDALASLHATCDFNIEPPELANVDIHPENVVADDEAVNFIVNPRSFSHPEVAGFSLNNYVINTKTLEELGEDVCKNIEINESARNFWCRFLSKYPKSVDQIGRFGKFVEIQFDASGRISGAAVRTYLLERSRVVQLTDPERNYHCFYQLCASGMDAEKYKLGHPSDFHYLNQSKTYELEGVSNAGEYTKTRRAMEIVGISQEEQEAIFRTLAAILHLGNIEFSPGKEHDSSVIKDEKSRSHLQMAAKLFKAGLPCSPCLDLMVFVSPWGIADFCLSLPSLHFLACGRIFGIVIVTTQMADENQGDDPWQPGDGVLTLGSRSTVKRYRKEVPMEFYTSLLSSNDHHTTKYYTTRHISSLNHTTPGFHQKPAQLEISSTLTLEETLPRLVEKINRSVGQDPDSLIQIGVLDIYGFECFKQNRNPWPVMKVKINFKVGNGQKVSFWHDNWIGQAPLKQKYPVLFGLCLQQEATIAKMWIGQG